MLRVTIAPMLIRHSLVILSIATAFVSTNGWAQDKTKDLSVVHQIKVEAFQNSKVMDHLTNLGDLYGPRLTASPEWEQAAEWA